MSEAHGVDAIEREFSPAAAADRQILIAGRSVCGSLLALYLAQAGYEPLLVGPAPAGAPSPAADLWRPGSVLLDRLGIGDVVDAGGALEAPDVYLPDGDRAELTAPNGPAGDATPGAIDVVDRTRLSERLRAAVPDEYVRPDWRIRELTPRPDGVQVGFTTGVREWFDVVVAAGPESGRHSETDAVDRPAASPLAGFAAELRLDARSLSRRKLVLADTGIAQLIPRPDAPRSRFVLSADAAPAGDPGSISAWRAAIPDLFPRAVTELLDASTVTGLHHRAVHQATRTAGRWRATGRAYCGPAAYPVAPAGSLGLALAVEDAWVLADELTRGPRSVSQTLANYARRRRRRVRDVLRCGRRSGAAAGFPFASQSEPLATVTRLRAAPIGAFLPEGTADLSTDVPGGL